MPIDAQRHELAWLAAEARIAAVDPVNLQRAKSWFARGLPAVVTRQDSDREWLALGIPLPPGECKKRIALRVPSSDIVRVSPPLPLPDVIASAPPAWRQPLTALTVSAAAIGIGLRVYGSLAWQHLTGADYLTPDSDIDLLWRPGGQPQLRAGLMLLSSWEAQSGLRADGEVWLADGLAVAWRELLNGATSVLVKNLRSVELRGREDVLARLAPAPDLARMPAR